MKMRSIVAGLFMATMIIGTAVAAEPAIDQLAWMAGSWQEQKGGLDIEEHWIAPKGGTMMAVNRAVKGGRTVEFDFMRIVERDGKLVYLASPGGRAPVEFPAKTVEAGRVVFENLAHDFPQRIIYTAESADVLVARIEGRKGGAERGMAWRFIRQK